MFGKFIYSVGSSSLHCCGTSMDLQLLHACSLMLHGGPQTRSTHSSCVSALAEVTNSKAIITKFVGVK